MTKMTYAQAIDFAINAVDNSEVKEKLEALKVQLAKRSGGKRGMTTTQKANVGIMDAIVEGLVEINKPVTVTELISSYAPLGEYTNQKISALLRKLVEDGRVNKYMEKKKAYFEVA